MTNGDATLTLLQLIHLNDGAVCECQAISVFLFILTGDVPYLIVIYNVVGGETYEPVARGLVAPVGVVDTVGHVIGIANVQVHPAARFNNVHHLGVLWHRLEDKGEVKHIGRQRISIVETYDGGILDGILLAASL